MPATQHALNALGLQIAIARRGLGWSAAQLAERLFQGQDVLTYTYARSYRDRPDAIALFAPELPLLPGTFDPTAPDQLPIADPAARSRGRPRRSARGCCG